MLIGGSADDETRWKQEKTRVRDCKEDFQTDTENVVHLLCTPHALQLDVISCILMTSIRRRQHVFLIACLHSMMWTYTLEARCCSFSSEHVCWSVRSFGITNSFCRKQQANNTCVITAVSLKRFCCSPSLSGWTLMTIYTGFVGPLDHHCHLWPFQLSTYIPGSHNLFKKDLHFSKPCSCRKIPLKSVGAFFSRGSTLVHQCSVWLWKWRLWGESPTPVFLSNAVAADRSSQVISNMIRRLYFRLSLMLISISINLSWQVQSNLKGQGIAERLHHFYIR